MTDILIITDNNGKLFYKYTGSKGEHRRDGANLALIKALLEQYGHSVEIMRISDIDFSLDYKGKHILYTSSETRGGLYKEYIEDVLMYMEKEGADLIPSIYHFRAHHNKGFQEMIRKKFVEKKLRSPHSIVIDTYESIYNFLSVIHYPVVLKMSKGSGSDGVVKVNDEKELLTYSKKMMTVCYRDYHDPRWFGLCNLKAVWKVKESVKKIIGRPATALQKDTVFCNTLIIQDFIKDLSGDYKVLFFGNHYYVLYRENRERDFRASGSGRFIFPESVEMIKDILDLAEMTAKELGMPCISMDIARGEKGCVLIEYQCVYFGNYTMQFAEWFYVRERGEWRQCEAEYEIEEEYCRAVHWYIAKDAAVNEIV